MWELYWLTRVDFIVATATMLLSASIFIFIFIFILIGWSIDGEMPGNVKCIRKYSCVIGTISLIIVAFMPTGKYSIAYGNDELLCIADNSIDACYEMILKLHKHKKL